MSLAGSEVRASWAPALVALAAGLAGFGFLYAETLANLIEMWNNHGAYGHAYLVFAISAFLVWRMRARRLWTHASGASSGRS